jgi:hypothetical protein
MPSAESLAMLARVLRVSTDQTLSPCVIPRSRGINAQRCDTRSAKAIVCWNLENAGESLRADPSSPRFRCDSVGMTENADPPFHHLSHDGKSARLTCSRQGGAWGFVRDICAGTSWIRFACSRSRSRRWHPALAKDGEVRSRPLQALLAGPRRRSRVGDPQSFLGPI